MKNLSLRSHVAKSLLIGLFAITSAMQEATAGVIFTATSATINSGGPGFGSINDTFNHNGLLTNYTNDVTDFDSYIAGGPLHSALFSGFEWFSNQGVSTASVTYNFGRVRSFDRLALWNEETSGIGLLDLLTSIDGINFTSLAAGLIPTNHPAVNAPYLADVFAVAAIAQYVRFDMSRCPQLPAGFDACAIGEVAFREPMGNNVPEPASLALVGAAFLGLVATRKRWQA